MSAPHFVARSSLLALAALSTIACDEPSGTSRGHSDLTCQAAITAFQPCGGEIVGTWKVRTSCAHQEYDDEITSVSGALASTVVFDGTTATFSNAGGELTTTRSFEKAAWEEDECTEDCRDGGAWCYDCPDAYPSGEFEREVAYEVTSPSVLTGDGFGFASGWLFFTLAYCVEGNTLTLRGGDSQLIVLDRAP